MKSKFAKKTCSIETHRQKKIYFFELGSINESVRPVARQYETLWFIFFFF